MQLDGGMLTDFEILQPGVDLNTVFFHDVVVRKHGLRQIMLLSMWDGGYVALDVTNPATGESILARRVVAGLGAASCLRAYVVRKLGPFVARDDLWRAAGVSPLMVIGSWLVVMGSG